MTIVHDMWTGDTLPSIELDLEDYDDDTETWVPADLTDADSVVLIYRVKNAATATTKVMTVVGDPTLGVVRYEWQVGETLDRGPAPASVRVTYADGGKRTYPDPNTKFRIVFHRSIDDED